MLLSSGLTTTASSDQAVSVLDNASGAGIIPSLILQLADKGVVTKDLDIVAADIDPMFLEQLQQRKSGNGQSWSRVRIEHADMQVSVLCASSLSLLRL